MGLDMYLNRKKYVGAEYEHRGVTGKVEIKINGKKLPIDFNKISYIEESVCYWRKANAIHKWFVDNVQDGVDDCRNAYVNLADLEKLLNVCKEVKKIAKMKKGKVECGKELKDGQWVPIIKDGEYIENREEIEKILPTSSGFFFGSTDYDEWYMQDIDFTIEKLENIIKEEKEMNKLGFYSDFEYRSSW